jgi:hypothetical protein
MKKNAISNIIAKKLEEALSTDKSLIYEVMIEGNKSEIDQAIKNAIHQSINNVLGEEFKSTIRGILLTHVKENANDILKNHFNLENIFSKSLFFEAIKERLPDLLNVEINIAHKRKKSKPVTKSKSVERKPK